MTPSSGKLPKVRQWTNPLDWGVHTAAASSHHSDPDQLPPYVPRDIDAELRRLLAKSGFVLLVGDSTAGKTRSAYEAVSATLPGHTLIIPTRTGISAALKEAGEHRKCVLWLNDINTWLSDPALNREALTGLLADPAQRNHRVVVATLRATEENRLRTQTDDAAASSTRRDAQELLSRAHRIELQRTNSEAEIKAARALTGDERSAGALAHTDRYGIAEFLANGPQLVAEWEGAWSANTDPNAPSHPRGAALVAAVVAIRLTGCVSDPPRALVEQVHENYLNERGGRSLNPEPLDQAWQWATRPRRATTHLLSDQGEDRVGVFDYLVDHVQQNTPVGQHIPEAVVNSALEHSTADDAFAIATTARLQGRYQLAERAVRQAYQNYRSQFGDEHSSTLTSRGNLAIVQEQLKHIEETDPL